MTCRVFFLDRALKRLRKLDRPTAALIEDDRILITTGTKEK